MNRQKIILFFYLSHFLILTLGFSIQACQPSPIDESKPSLAITNVTVIDAHQGQLENMTVLIQENRILKVEKSEDLSPPESSTVINGQGKYLIPGLWDAHVHLTYDADITPAMFDLFLINGITSIRDTGGKIELVKPLKEEANNNPNTSPRVMISGPLIDGIPTVYDGNTPGRPELGVGVGTPDEARVLVRQLKNEGVDLLKAYEMLQPEVYQAVLEEAKVHGLPVTGHVPLSMDVVSASKAGLNSIEHMRNLEMSCTRDWSQLMEIRRKELANGKEETGGALRSRLHQLHRYQAIANQDPATRSEVLSALAENNTWLVPTLTILAARENRVWARPKWRADYKYLPDSVDLQWTTRSVGIADLPVDSLAVVFANWGYDMVSRLPDAGVKIMAGTDTPIAFLTPGFSLHEELRLLVKSGLTPLEVLEAATIRPAEYFNMEEELGTIEEGKLADLVLLKQNPLEDIRNSQSIDIVIKNGNLLNRETLAMMAKKLDDK